MHLITRSRRTSLFALFLGGLLATIGCSDSPTGSNNTNNGTNDTPQTITGDHYIQAKVDGKYQTVQEEMIGTTGEWGMGFTAEESTRDNDFLSIHETYFVKVTISGGFPVLDTNQTFFFSFIGILAERPSDDDDYDVMMRTGSWEFGSEAVERAGIEIRWRDKNGKAWSTSLGSGDQTGSSFQIDVREKLQYPQPWVGPYHIYRITGKFNCTLYDGSGNSIPVTDGKYVIKAVLGQ